MSPINVSLACRVVDAAAWLNMNILHEVITVNNLLMFFQVVDGFTLQKRIPLDGTSGNVKLEVKANFAFPEPEIEYSTETQRSLVGMGDIEVSIDELNLLLDY